MQESLPDKEIAARNFLISEINSTLPPNFILLTSSPRDFFNPTWALNNDSAISLSDGCSRRKAS